ncbi:hypothetical protein ACLOJK_040387 [Asimina triloba]
MVRKSLRSEESWKMVADRQGASIRQHEDVHGLLGKMILLEGEGSARAEVTWPTEEDELAGGSRQRPSEFPLPLVGFVQRFFSAEFPSVSFAVSAYP